MLGKARSRLTFANVTALLALVIALGGTALADPVAESAASLKSNVKRALRIGKRADRKATRALNLARLANQNASKVNSLGGPAGPQGPRGLAATNVLARSQFSGAAVTTTAAGPTAGTSAPLIGGSWTQESDESDLIFFAQVTFTHPGACGPGGTGYVDLYIDGTYEQSAGFAESGGSHVTRPLSFAGFLEPPTASVRTLTAKVRDTGCADPAAHLTVHNLNVT